MVYPIFMRRSSLDAAAKCSRPPSRRREAPGGRGIVRPGRCAIDRVERKKTFLKVLKAALYITYVPAYCAVCPAPRRREPRRDQPVPLSCTLL